METRTGPWTGFKRWLIDKTVGAEKRALVGRLAGIDGKLDAVSARVTEVEAAQARTARLVRRQIAERKLMDQVALVPGLGLAGGSRSVIFLHHSYYHFLYLARALRKRGWRAISASIEDPNGVNAGYYHGEDVNMHDPDPEQLQANIEALFSFAKANFDLMHFAGDGHMGFFPQHFASDDPPDILEWKRLGKKVAYSLSGCNSLIPQSQIHAWTRQPSGASMCDNCPWQLRPDVCRDDKTEAWAGKVHRHCDMVFTDLQPSLAHSSAHLEAVVRGPMSMVVDPDVWRPDLPVPAAFQVPREPGEVLVYHAFGNYQLRGSQGRNIKGTPAVVQAVERLRAEGLPVRMLFATGVRNDLVRFYQAQADIIVDQLWAGRWGANGREALMLGKPVVAYVNRQDEPGQLLEPVADTPVISATVETLHDVLKALVLDPERRQVVGRRSREYALEWYSPQAGAARYEAAYDAMLARNIKLELPVAAPAVTS